ncbi:WD40 repeat domain-containing protein [Actinoallomurus iriomotensis]|uniref:Uncharacterized protein n=1 Tax=Actinoallomurus iriomotensis TaxID=478107 RepID=A0A9W6S8I9_9ACTN|nr:WD40 repeat domain-containing protein [Actinoallomurus iriomotensis]GLY90315.1 hypothetical protein Airi02_082440 [Actinoallomurus iriomotensis]
MSGRRRDPSPVQDPPEPFTADSDGADPTITDADRRLLAWIMMSAVGAALVVLLVVVVYGVERPDPSARPGPVATLPAAGGIRAVDFSPDGRLLAVGGDDGPVPDRKVALPGGPPATFGGGELGVVCIGGLTCTIKSRSPQSD